MKRGIVCLLLSMIVGWTIEGAESAAKDVSSEATKILADASKDFPGLSVAVAVDGEIVWTAGYGVEDLERGTPVGEDSKFLVFSAAKAWTATAAGRLLERGKLRMDQPVREVVTDFPDKGAPMTVYQLATHAAGIRHYEDEAEAIDPGHCRSVSDALAIFADDPLLFTPGERQAYSSWGYVLLSAVVERAAEAPFGEVMRSEIFAPSGMDSTVHADPTSDIPGRTTPYRRDDEGGFVAVENLDASCKWGAGGFLSTPSDLVRFYVAMMEGRLLSPPLAKMVMNPDQDGVTRFGGASVGGRSLIHADAKRNVVVAIVANERGDDTDLGVAVEAIVDLFAEAR